MSDRKSQSSGLRQLLADQFLVENREEILVSCEVCASKSNLFLVTPLVQQRLEGSGMLMRSYPLNNV